jgi:cytochrome oxidase Cu insertion factor (SCO1/SenC/PrrC family)
MALVRMRWAIWGTAALVGLGAGIALLLLRSSSPAASPAMVGGAATTWPAGKQKAPAFSLLDQNGNAVSLRAYRGRPLIVTFLDPLCRNYCPVEASRLNDVVRSLPPGSRPAIVAVSVNVFGNARRYLAQDIHKWKLGGEFRWGVGTPSQLGSVWKHYDIGVLDQSKKIAGVEVHNIVHTEAAYIVDAQGYERALYLWPFAASDVLKVLRNLA